MPIALPNPPSPLGAFEKTLFALPLNIGQTLEHYFSYWYKVLTPDELNWRRFVLTCETTASADTADDAKITFDFVNYTGGAIDPTWDGGDYSAVAGNLFGVLDAVIPHQATFAQWTKLDAYVMSFNPNWVTSTDPKTPIFNQSGAPDYTAPIAKVGTMTGAVLGPQSSFSVTEEVPRRPNWGRFYIPFFGANALSGASRWTTPTVDAIVQAVHDCYATLASDELYPVVASAYSAKVHVAALQQITAVRADDVVDVIRRRRSHRKLYGKRLPISAATKPAF